MIRVIYIFIISDGVDWIEFILKYSLVSPSRSMKIRDAYCILVGHQPIKGLPSAIFLFADFAEYIKTSYEN